MIIADHVVMRLESPILVKLEVGSQDRNLKIAVQGRFTMKEIVRVPGIEWGGASGSTLAGYSVLATGIVGVIVG